MSLRDNSPSTPLARITGAFHEVFLESENTELKGGAAEPVYLPAAGERQRNEIWFTRDYLASALHEISHWCIAGVSRRKLVDYGYWYAPDGRTSTQQLEFEQVEVKPQALEWILSVACGVGFRLSADNVEQGAIPSESFRQSVWRQAHSYCELGLGDRSRKLIETFASEFGVEQPLARKYFSLADLR